MTKIDIAWVMVLAATVAGTGFLIVEYQSTMARLESRAKEATAACHGAPHIYRGKEHQPKADDISWRSPSNSLGRTPVLDR